MLISNKQRRLTDLVYVQGSDGLEDICAYEEEAGTSEGIRLAIGHPQQATATTG